MKSLQRSLLLVACLCLLSLSGCFSPESRLYGVWQAPGIVGVGVGRLEFKSGGEAVLTNVLGEQPFGWTVIESSGNDYRIGWTTGASDLLVERKLTFVDNDTIDIELLNSATTVRMIRMQQPQDK